MKELMGNIIVGIGFMVVTFGLRIGGQKTANMLAREFKKNGLDL